MTESSPKVLNEGISPSPKACRSSAASTDSKLDLEITEAISSPVEQHQGMASILRMGTNTGGVVTSEEYMTEEEKKDQDLKDFGYHKFYWSSLWRPAEINPLNGKSYTFPIFRIWDIYSTSFWLATLGFFVAFLSWFAFSPLMPEAVKKDLNLTSVQVTHSNMASLGGTAIVRLVAGPACDRFGPRKVMAALLVLGAIPSGLAALVTSAGGLYTVRFFISILGATFVCCQAWVSTFYDKSIVGTANAFSGGWGNSGGGVTIAAMIGLFNRFRAAGLSSHLAWRVCFPSLPVPCLLLIAAMILLFGKDHPAGKWSQRHQFSGTAIAIAQGESVQLDSSERAEYERREADNEKAPAKLAHFREPNPADTGKRVATVDTAQSEPLTLKRVIVILSDPRVWMCIMCYFLTFGLETAMDAALPGLITTLFSSKTFTAIDAAYAASMYGLLNLYARPIGGVVSDLLYSKYGLRGRVFWLLVTAFSQGIAMIGLGVYCNHNPTLGGVLAFIFFIGTTGFLANGANYGIPAIICPSAIGTVSGLVGAAGNVGGLMYLGIFLAVPGVRKQKTLGTKFWIAGVVNAGTVLPFFAVLLPGKYGV
ncbi:related to nitrate transporter [Melanopsichium pennsylvanicum]|uniref:Related to nitrate transporter n=2 Tax=Melanopsichium pennsylvanicum TaxID=63383 RepID=A0AAJ5C5V1_9BASI|nr:related to nitrate transporter [Melanopsichium pennsylvanicum 4]SNX85142.1 related to nitrate transporter [Melanopsichium pennsylvanicum]